LSTCQDDNHTSCLQCTCHSSLLALKESERPRRPILVVELLLDEFFQIVGTSFRPVYIAHSIRRHAFRHGLFVRLRSDARNEGLHRTLFCAHATTCPSSALTLP